MGLEICFEFSRFFAGSEGDGGFDSPGSEFGGVRHLAVVVGFESAIKIFGKSCIMAGLV